MEYRHKLRPDLYQSIKVCFCLERCVGQSRRSNRPPELSAGSVPTLIHSLRALNPRRRNFKVSTLRRATELHTYQLSTEAPPGAGEIYLSMSLAKAQQFGETVSQFGNHYKFLNIYNIQLNSSLTITATVWSQNGLRKRGEQL